MTDKSRQDADEQRPARFDANPDRDEQTVEFRVTVDWLRCRQQIGRQAALAAVRRMSGDEYSAARRSAATWWKQEKQRRRAAERKVQDQLGAGDETIAAAKEAAILDIPQKPEPRSETPSEPPSELAPELAPELAQTDNTQPPTQTDNQTPKES